MKEKKKKSAAGRTVLQFLAGLAAGAAVGVLLAATAPSPLMAMWCLVLCLPAFLLHILLHEGGHLVCSLLTGYRFLSFRISSWVLQKEESGLRLRRLPMRGTLGQCLLIPPPEGEEQPFVLYHLGGGLANLLAAGCAALWLAVWGYQPFAVAMVVCGLYLGVANLIPTRSMPNDGANIRDARRGPQWLDALQSQLRLNAFLATGGRIQDLTPEALALPAGLPPASNFAVPLVMMDYSRLQALGLLEEGFEVLQRLLLLREELCPYFARELDAEHCFCLCMTGQAEEAKKLYAQRLKKWLPADTGLDKMRVRYAYLLLAEKKGGEAEKVLQKALAAARNYPLPSVADSERRLLDRAVQLAAL